MHLSNPRYLSIPGCYDVTVVPDEGEPFDYTVSPDDPAPMAVAIRAVVVAENIQIAAYLPPLPTGADVNAERDRRSYPGSILVSGAGPAAIAVDMRSAVDKANLTALAVGAGIAAESEDLEPISFIDAENAVHELSSAQMRLLALGALKHVRAVYAAARALKDETPIPSDFASDDYWPTPEVEVP